MEYDLELDNVCSQIRSKKSKLVCIQLPDGLKMRAKEIQPKIEKETGAKVVIWLGSCFGACDIPESLNKLGVDLLVQWGHSRWKS